jgi:hypothetical protein
MAALSAWLVLFPLTCAVEPQTYPTQVECDSHISASYTEDGAEMPLPVCLRQGESSRCGDEQTGISGDGSGRAHSN